MKFNLHSESQAVKFSLLFILTLTMLRVFLLFVNGMPLYGDEAQYWIWSQNLEFGYYSKPPMIAALIAASTWLLGDGEAGVRFLSPIIHMLTSVAIFALARRLFDWQVAVLSALIFITLPSIFLSSMLISTDVPLMLIWTLMLIALHRAIERNQIKDWCIAGALAGLGLMTKYHFGIILPATLIYCAWTGKLANVMRSPGPYMGVMIAALIFAPNVYWNLENSFVSFSHTADLAGAKSSFSMHLGMISLKKFLLDQLVVFGIFLLPFTIICLIKVKRNTDAIKFLSAHMLTFIAVIAVFAIKNKAHANWAAPAYVSGSILAGHFFINLNKINWFKYNTLLHCAFGIIIMVSPFFMLNMPNFKPNPFARVMGYEKLGSELDVKRKEYTNSIIATDDRKAYALMVYYSHPHLFDLKKFNDRNQVADHFDLTTPLDRNAREIIVISKHTSPDSLKHHFNGARVEELKFDNSLGYKAFYVRR